MIIGQKIRAHHGHECAGQEKRGQHRAADGQCERAKKKAPDAAHKRQRREHQHRGAGRYQDGNKNLAATIDGRADPGFAEQVIAMIVLQLHNRIVNRARSTS